METRVMICCIGKNENPYIREYVEHYKKLNATNICLFDNNDIDGEHYEDVIGDYIQSGFVILKNYRGRTCCQWEAYEECYNTYKHDYDWIAFFDCDEFLEFKNRKLDIPTYLSDSRFNDYDMIHINWMCYGDNGNLKYEDKPVQERFKKPVMPLNFTVKFGFPENYHTKSIIRGYIDDIDIRWLRNSHTPSTELACCDSLGREVHRCTSPFTPYDFSLAWLKHYTTKSTEEYCQKIKRGFPDITPRTFAEQKDMAERYFRYNKKTEDKLKLIEDMTGIKVSKTSIDNIIYFGKDYKNWR